MGYGITDDEGAEHSSDSSSGSGNTYCSSTSTNELGSRIDISIADRNRQWAGCDGCDSARGGKGDTGNHSHNLLDNRNRTQ